jgi:hypothetical protein
VVKKRKKTFKVAREARRRARAIAGMPPSEQVIPDKRHRTPKHKKPLRDEVEP